MSIVCPLPQTRSCTSNSSILLKRFYCSTWVTLNIQSNTWRGQLFQNRAGHPGQNSNMQRVSGQMPTHLLCSLSSSSQKPKLSTVECLTAAAGRFIRGQNIHVPTFLPTCWNTPTVMSAYCSSAMMDARISPNRCNSSTAPAQACMMNMVPVKKSRVLDFV